ncbi:hypothetical protein [Clostridium sp. ZBS15]|uniref:hypothetical protein n=1 Tax=Clostridium sp. ZBS15 TaxID=2949969 RepID=UPI00207A6D3D|nr:hypothetical protein [Clostridium sp. ZBS15]
MNEYIYRKHLRNPGKYLLLMMGFVLSILIETGIISCLKSINEDMLIFAGIFAIIALAILTIIGLEYLLLYFVMFRKFKKVSVELTDSGIIYKNIKGTTFIRYEEIQAIQFPSIRYFGGWTKIKSKEKNIRLTVVLENIEHFMQDLKCILDEKNLSHVYNDKKLYNFRKTATYSDQSWERVYEKIKSLSVTYFIGILISILYLGFINLYATQIIFQLLITLYPFFAFIFSEIILGFKLSKDIKTSGKIITKRNKEFENRVYKYTSIVLGILTLSILIISMI